MLISLPVDNIEINPQAIQGMPTVSTPLAQSLRERVKHHGAAVTGIYPQIPRYPLISSALKRALTSLLLTIFSSHLAGWKLT
jgi:hypothetical protein